ncbi:hypothetical protein [Streptomyces sp. NBC_00258]|uniref:hypothetical protein n=1 Tax=Streptomyces sp. NBC_00258 TaxID=2903642 RepID=UPI002E2809B3|nr:hypothetical protein [Streptomyces sp. NBC_00258]
MSPVLRAKSSLSPLATRGAWLTGGAVASLALVFAGVATPASASVTPAADSVVADPSTDDCKKENGHHEKYQPEGKAQTPGGPLHEKCEDRDRDKQECSDIDSARSNSGNWELSAVLTGGNAFAGVREAPADDDYEWKEISDESNYPKNACAISIVVSNNGQEATVKVLTKNGRVYESEGNRPGDSDEFNWSDWVKLETPREDDLATREKGEQVTPVG